MRTLSRGLKKFYTFFVTGTQKTFVDKMQLLTSMCFLLSFPCVFIFFVSFLACLLSFFLSLLYAEVIYLECKVYLTTPFLVSNANYLF